jgi:hypothetical protein
MRSYKILKPPLLMTARNKAKAAYRFFKQPRRIYIITSIAYSPQVFQLPSKQSAYASAKAILMPNSNKKLQQSHPTNTTNVAYETC